MALSSHNAEKGPRSGQQNLPIPGTPLSPRAEQVTRLLEEAAKGGDATDRLLPLVYDELRRLAGRYLSEERGGHTLQPTALVHEAYLRLLGGQENTPWRNRAHFMGVAARAMRQVLVNHAVRRNAQKREGGRARQPLDEVLLIFEERSIHLTALDKALSKLARLDERQSRIVELRFFGGLTEEETSELLGLSSRTVRREWRLARAWLRREIEQDQ